MNKLVFQLGKGVSNVSEYLPALDPQIGYKECQFKEYEDMIDSLASALIGLDYLGEKTVGFGGEDGTIWIPIKMID